MRASNPSKYLFVLVSLAILLFANSHAGAQSDLIITGVVDGPLSGGTPKAVEFFVLNDIPDLSIYGFGSANNGGGSDGEEFTFPADAVTAGTYLYVATEATEFANWFGFAPDYTHGTAANINGNDAIELFKNGSVVDVFGEITVDGTGQPWEYLDGWAYRVDETGPDGSTFVLSNWFFSGPNALDGETSNATAATPFPTASYRPPPPQVTGTKTDALTTDNNTNSLVDVGDVLTYTIVITNSGSGSAWDVTFADLAGDHPNTTLVDGSVTTSQGTVTSGNGGGPDTDVTVDVGDVAADGGSATITFQVTVGDPSPDSEICNQGAVSGRNFSDVLTDDPNTVPAAEATCTPVVMPPPLPHNFLFLAEEFVESKQHKRIEGDIHSNNDIELKKGKKSEIIGNLFAVDDIEIAKKNDIDGNVTAGSDIDNDGAVTGAIEVNANVVVIPIPDVAPFAFGDGDFEVDKKESGELDPGAYKEVQVKKNGKLLLKHDGNSGEYFLKTLELNKKAMLCIDVSNGPVVINVARELIFGTESEVIIKPNGQEDTELVTFNFADDDDKKEAVEIGKKTIVLGTIIAPDAWVEIKDKARFKGAICAENIVVKKGVVAYHHSVSGSLPKIVPDEYDDEELLIAAAIPTEFELTQNYPNPFNPSTTISFALPQASDVSLRIYNLRGQLVATLHDGALTSGRHQMVWDGRDARGLQVASGIYLYRLETGGPSAGSGQRFVATKKLTLMK